MPRVEFESQEQKERFDEWMQGVAWDGRFIRSGRMPLGGEGQGILEINYTKDDAIIVIDEACDFSTKKPVLVTSDDFIEELRGVGIIFDAYIERAGRAPVYEPSALARSVERAMETGEDIWENSPAI